MIIIPKEKPVVENLNSYYIMLDKFLEHYQGALESGGIYFYSPNAEAVIFFDDENVLNGFYREKASETAGQAAVDKIFQTVGGTNFSVSVYRIRPDRLYYWANLPGSSILYRDLSSEFADLEGLIKKMENEKLTGYIEVQLGQQQEQGLLFFYNGELLGGTTSKGKSDVDRTPAYRDDLIKRCREEGGVFNVHKTDLHRGPIQQKPKPSAPEKEFAAPQAEVKPTLSAAGSAGATDTQQVVQMLRDLLVILETVVRSSKRQRYDFETLLNRKFMEKVDKYEFLDPFAAEIRYAKGNLAFDGDASPEQLIAGVTECVRELVVELEVSGQFRKRLGSWQSAYSDQIERYGIDI
jgi:hypothetical protein